MENVKVKITTVQTVDEARNEDIIEFVTEATLEKIDTCFIINYDESDITESKGSRTRLKIYKDKMVMTKIGTYSSKMEFEEKISNKNLYTTPYGTFDLDFTTIIYDNSLDEFGKGQVYIEYKIIFGNTGDNYNKLKIDIF
ncbi:MAG: DUF1934 domain-containing protein [Sedimentibacter sp.]|uniref:DUF1934 domain-containing protein n=1 Tax=Sedimentibacter sp. TaxID=1960295 RepID=UPI0029829DBA|nr:DUF1934 domain-containing protein [Sedimentibacter sp.]MDW5299425.1 DUF1934 domain-containing protein [Sedimentibacter sp.]